MLDEGFLGNGGGDGGGNGGGKVKEEKMQWNLDIWIFESIFFFLKRRVYK